jgi:lipopolysaccharide biosynthesis protein
MRAWASSFLRISVLRGTSLTGAATAKFARGCIFTGDALAARCPDYPAGSFFWARTRYLQPLFALDLTDADFPEEMSQSDGTLAHAVERMIGLLDKPTGMVKQCVSVTPPLTLDDLAGMVNG